MISNPVEDAARTHRHKASLLAALAGATLLGAGCASKPPAPTAQIQAAQQAIDGAERAQAAQHAAPELSQARSKLAAANSAMQDKEMEQATRLAAEALADAELATARTAAVKAQAANDEIRRSNRAVLEEMNRSTSGGTP